MVTSISAEVASAAELRRRGRALGRRLRAGDLVLLSGDLGSGKTTLAAAVARGAGWTGRVPSPTFQLVREYQGRLPVLHADLHRLGSPREAEELGILEFAETGACLVEWPERWPALEARAALRVTLVVIGETSRRLQLSGRDDLVCTLAGGGG
ncbi:MAG: tRNA (adenosine(37)-N6)-threonylcarbamoyltransferase complex ATPase subunit type 1 TsaE [Candidatus Dormibacteria bacterium]